jgi:hypothetical protein
MVDAAGDNRGICLSLCDAYGSGGPTCPSGTSCVATLLPLTPTVSAVEYYSDTGACGQTCTPPSSTDAGTGPGGTDAGMDGGAPDGGMDAGSGATDGGCPAPTTCVNGSITSTADYVCLP